MSSAFKFLRVFMPSHASNNNVQPSRQDACHAMQSQILAVNTAPSKQTSPICKCISSIGARRSALHSIFSFSISAVLHSLVELQVVALFNTFYLDQIYLLRTNRSFLPWLPVKNSLFPCSPSNPSLEYGKLSNAISMLLVL